MSGIVGAARVVVGERALGGEHVPRVVDVVGGHPQPEGEMHAHRLPRWHVLGHELTLRIQGMVRGEFLGRVGDVVRIDDPANSADGGIVRWLHEPDAVVVGQRHGWRHGAR